MSRRRYPLVDELLPSQEELDAAKSSAGAAPTGAAYGSGIGALAGGSLGALGLLVPGLGALTIPAGLSAGSALGGAIGGSIGGAVADNAENTVRKLGAQRQKALSQSQLRQQALAALMAEG